MTVQHAKLFDGIKIADIHRDVVRNIVSLRKSEHLFDDLSSDPADWQAAQRIEMEIKPPHFTNHQPVINRPFEEAAWNNAVQWPFNHWSSSRFSAGRHGVWYSSAEEETTIYETVYHWHRGLLTDAGFEGEPAIIERKLYNVYCEVALIDLRPAIKGFAELLHPTDYSAAQDFGARLVRDGYPGLIVPSVRHLGGENFALFNPAGLSNPRDRCFLTYRLEGQRVIVEKSPGQQHLVVDIS